MRVILSGVHQKKSKKELELELIDMPSFFDNLQITFLETNSLATFMLPVINIVDNNLARIIIDPQKLQFSTFNQNEFTWQIFLGFVTNHEHVLLQVESEYLSDRHQLSLTSFFQVNSDLDGMAILSIHTKQSEDEFSINSVNLIEGTIKLTGNSLINNQHIKDQQIIMRDVNTSESLIYPIGKENLRGLFNVSIPLSDISKNANISLFIHYMVGTKIVEQRIVFTRSLEGQNVQTRLKSGRIMLLGKNLNSGILVREYPALTIFDKLSALPNKLGAMVELWHLIEDKINLQFMRMLFKRGHRPYETTTIIFESFGGRQVSDSPFAIYTLFKNLYPGFNFVWSIDRSLKKFCHQHGIPYVIRRTSKWVRILEKSSYWISNARFPSWVRKPKYVTYIQTWHGTPLKKLGLDIKNVSMPGTTTSKYHANFIKEANRWDVLVAPNDYSTMIFRSAFGFNNQILKVGYPRNDELINSTPDDIITLKERLGIPVDKKVVLYAPTYRDNQFEKKGKYTFELPFSLDEFKKQFGDDTVLILRMHYLIAKALDIGNYTDFVYDFSSYSNISELYLVSDMLITDYSSVFFDYAYLKRPILFYPYDYHLYKDELRGFYLNYEKELPGKIANSQTELMWGIDHYLGISNMSNDAKFMKFYNRFCAIDDGLSSLKIVNYVVHQIEKNV